jgi:hypothetical protein
MSCIHGVTKIIAMLELEATPLVPDELGTNACRRGGGYLTRLFATKRRNLRVNQTAANEAGRGVRQRGDGITDDNSISKLGSNHQVGDFHIKRFCNAGDMKQPGILLATLDRPHVRAIDSVFQCQLFLGYAASLSGDTDACTEADKDFIWGAGEAFGSSDFFGMTSIAPRVIFSIVENGLEFSIFGDLMTVLVDI